MIVKTLKKVGSLISNQLLNITKNTCQKFKLQSNLTSHFQKGCTDDDECALDLHHCDPVHAECKNTNGSYDCQCKTGFEGDGFDCHVCTVVY